MTPAMEAQARRLCQYIRNTGQIPLRTDDFDDDWSPVGEDYRAGLRQEGLIEERLADSDEPGGIYLTAAGEALAVPSGSFTPG